MIMGVSKTAMEQACLHLKFGESVIIKADNTAQVYNFVTNYCEKKRIKKAWKIRFIGMVGYSLKCIHPKKRK